MTPEVRHGQSLIAVIAALLVATVDVVGQSCPLPETVPHVAPVSMLATARLTLVRCTLADLDRGRWRHAERRLAAAAAVSITIDARRQGEWQALVARLEARRRIDGQQWTSLVTDVVPFEEALPWVGPLVRGVAAARSSWARQDAALQAAARRELDRLAALAHAAGGVSEAEQARLLVQGAMAGAQYERDEMQLLLEAAHDLEQRLSAGDELRLPVMLAKELEADLLRVTDRYAAASERYRDVLVEHPTRVQSRLGLADAYRRLGYARQADETLAQARMLWADADPEALSLLEER